MNSRLATRRLAWFAVAVAVVILGYVSNSFSAGACEVAVAHRVAGPLGSDFFVLPESESLPDTYPGSEAILHRAGFTPRSCPRTAPFDGVCFPWVGVGRARSVAPYVLEIGWGEVHAPLGGGGGHARIVAVFGFIVWQWGHVEWVT